ncbi:hypothetical protein KC322_g102 [Hortaea werneckii]|nr:hypothetical protein KC322_g102 [Hortaea werneckii]
MRALKATTWPTCSGLSSRMSTRAFLCISSLLALSAAIRSQSSPCGARSPSDYGLVYAVARLIHTSSRSGALLAIAVGCGGAAAARLEALQGVGQRRHVGYRSGAVIWDRCVCALRHRQTQRWEVVIEGGRVRREVGATSG